MNRRPVFSAALVLSAASAARAGLAVNQLLGQFEQEGAGPFSATSGQHLWTKRFTGPDGVRQCTSCHTADPRQAGRHIQTGKRIAPLAPSINATRLTHPGKVSKWLKRNCKWTMGRGCSAQDRGDLLAYLTTL